MKWKLIKGAYAKLRNWVYMHILVESAIACGPHLSASQTVSSPHPRKEYHCDLWDYQSRLVIAGLMLAICSQRGAWEEALGDFSEKNFFHQSADPCNFKQYAENETWPSYFLCVTLTEHKADFRIKMNVCFNSQSCRWIELCRSIVTGKYTGAGYGAQIHLKSVLTVVFSCILSV